MRPGRRVNRPVLSNLKSQPDFDAGPRPVRNDIRKPEHAVSQVCYHITELGQRFDKFLAWHLCRYRHRSGEDSDEPHAFVHVDWNTGLPLKRHLMIALQLDEVVAAWV